jgi:hypothetical protein
MKGLVTIGPAAASTAISGTEIVASEGGASVDSYPLSSPMKLDRH